MPTWLRTSGRACYAGTVRALLIGTIIVALALALALGSSAGAGESDRTELMARIEDAIHAIATALDAHKLDDAALHDREVRELIAQLAAVQGNDGRAADIVAHYPTYANVADAAIARLGVLAQEVHRTDNVAARCSKDDLELHAFIQRRTSRPSPDPARDLEAVAAKADEYAATWSPTLIDLANTDRSIVREVTASKLAITDGYWMAVTTSVAAEANAIVEPWPDRYAAVTAACAPLGLGQHHAEVAPVLAALRTRIRTDHTAATALAKDYNAWLASVRTLRELALQGRTVLHDAICQATDGEVASRVGAVASTWGRDLEDRTTEAIAEGSRLRTGNHLPRAISEGLKVAGAIVASIAREEGQGRANPRLVTALAVIAKRREHSLAASKCVATNVELACTGRTCRATCIAITDRVCTIVEPVTDQEGAKAAGFARAQQELDAAKAWYTRDKAGLFARVPALARCELAARATLDLATDVVSYATCSAVTLTMLGEPLGEVPLDL